MKNLQNFSREELARRVFEVSYLRGEFRLRSGQISNEYFDKYKFEADPDLLWSIACQAKELIPEGTEVLAGLEMGGIPVATALGLATGIPCAFVRKAAKAYGTAKVAEGVDLKNKRVVIIEDVITTGGQVLLSVEDLRQAGAIVDHVICVIDREQGGPEKLATKNLRLSSLFTMSELKS